MAMPLGVPFGGTVRSENNLMRFEGIRQAGERHLMAGVEGCKKGLELSLVGVVGHVS